MIDFSHKPTIEGEKVILRPFKTEEDFPYIEECLLDPEVVKLTGSSPEYNRDETIDWYNTRNKQVNRLDLAIVDKIQHILIGEAVVNLYDEKNHRMNFRILIGPKGRNRGLGTEATQLIVDYVFKNSDLNELTLGVFAFNPRAKKVYEKAGFIIDSIDKNDLEFEGEWIDSINMKLTRNNWIEKQDKKSESMRI
ncbi:GNAT family N-acetyltransferase [Virgibacillus profundi]|uniref:GNAT family N-acetyltransferase n=1 Tax=Virgibacillus profundi TaxID=2024555 RepID=A0A2A2I6L8_9BACI|nr:GNAT family protein [Virgibacillus profundi]PAV27651.1 GNAT family N-acetyltransferase [Virgibacillus profundi]PXY51981.1 N-acetyltransferase [Virgibacillus profundi]